MVPLCQFFTNGFESIFIPLCIGNKQKFCHNFVLPNLSYWLKKNSYITFFLSLVVDLFNFTCFNAFLISFKVFKFSRAYFGFVGLFELKVEIKGNIFFFSCSFTFLNSFWDVFKALFTLFAFIVLSG